MRRFNRGLVAVALLLLFGATACSDFEVTNLNDPDAIRAGQTAGDVESLIAGSFNNWHGAQYSYNGVAMWMSNASFQHTAPWANFGMEYYGRIPRNRIENDAAHAYYGNTSHSWNVNYSAISAVADGFRAIDNTSNGVADELGADAVDRLKAYGYYVLGLGHASIALLYDQGFIVDQNVDVIDADGNPIALTAVDYATLMDQAMVYFDSAIAHASDGWGAAADIPATWMSVSVSPAQLTQLAYTHKARFAANVARTPAERADVSNGGIVDWTQVMADANTGITADWVMDMNGYIGWYASALAYASYPGWTEAPYFVTGMADQGGNYQRWLALTPASTAKIPNPASGDIVIETADTRFPQGSDIATQQENDGTLWYSPDDITNVWARPDRGKWRWSYYMSLDGLYYSYFADWNWPQATVAELDLLRAEGEYRLNGAAAAAPIVNGYRTANGLNAFDGSSGYDASENTSCVPKLPNGNCGDLWEALKWEKRMETHFKGLYMNSWWLDGRGWGDLFVGSPLQLPVPCREVQTLALGDCNFYGGVGGEMAAPVSTYSYPDETQ